eukprot:SAG31_NODE_11076_length_1069_cov_0.848454_1_plen_125_part_00
MKRGVPRSNLEEFGSSSSDDGDSVGLERLRGERTLSGLVDQADSDLELSGSSGSDAAKSSSILPGTSAATALEEFESGSSDDSTHGGAQAASSPALEYDSGSSDDFRSGASAAGGSDSDWLSDD